MSIPALVPVLYNRLRLYPALVTIGVDVHTNMRPSTPEGIRVPQIVISLPELADEVGLHGGALNLSFEVETWGYGASMLKACASAAHQVSMALVSRPLSLPDGSVSLRLISETGVQAIPEQDVRIIHLQERFTSRFWSQERISVLT